MYCKKCGNQIPNDSLFCPKCGTDVAEENDKVTNGEQDILTPEQVTQKSAAEECDSLQKEKAGAHDNVTSSLEKGNDKELKKQNRKKAVLSSVKWISGLIIFEVLIVVIILQSGVYFQYKLINDHYIITQYTGNQDEVTIPDTIWFRPVTEISESAFKDSSYNKHITSIKLGKNITSIGKNAFMGCTLLEELDCSAVKIENGDEFMIMDRAFKGCEKLRKIILPDSRIHISNEAFKGCAALQIIQTYEHDNPYYKAAIGVLSKGGKIGENTFENCISLDSLNLTNVTLSSNSFTNCTGLTELYINSGSFGDYRTSTEKGGVFKGCTKLRSVDVYFMSTSDYQTVIPNECFADCISLTNFSGSNISSIGNNAFLNCTALTDLYIEPYPSEIAKNAFDNCTNLELEYNSSNETDPISDGNNNNQQGYDDHKYAATNFMGLTVDEAVSILGSDYIIKESFGSYSYEYSQYGLNIPFGANSVNSEKITKIIVYPGNYISKGWGEMDKIQPGMTNREVFAILGYTDITESAMLDGWNYSYVIGGISFEFSSSTPEGGLSKDPMDAVVFMCWVCENIY